MNPERWKQIDEAAQAALDLGADKRTAFLDEACAGDDSLRREVESQIAYQQQASKFLEEPAFKHAAELMAETQSETESMEGRTISHYSILRKLGAGGMGEVYLAQDTTLSRMVAIKFLSQDSAAGEHSKKRLVREAKAAAALDHHHICAVYEVGEEAGYNFIVMQYVEGETLASRIQRQPIEFLEALEIAVQIADALTEAHSHGIIHRDVKPQNVMLTASGQVKVLDFGLSKVVREGPLIDSISETESLLSLPGSVIGTVPYMSPEQVRGEALDGRSDIFSFGAVLYEMLSGRNPFQAESVGGTMSSILTKEPAPLARYASDVPDELQRMVRKALSKDKEGRYQGIKDLLIDLRELKQELEFEAKLERSIEPETRERSTILELAESVGQANAQTAPGPTVHTRESFTTHTTSSTRIVIGEIKRHKLGVVVALVALIIVASAALLYFNRKPVLTDKDTILLADFDNTTGDEVFDSALKQGLAVQLEQSPFLNIFPGERIQQTLRLMGRSPDVRVTRDIGREVCERQGLKAMIVGSIAPLGSHYVIAVEAINAHSGNVLARDQVEAESKEQVLSVLGKTAIHLREKLGESMSTIQKFDAPMEATTSSLEALRAFSAGRALHLRGNDRDAIPYLRRAVELDPQFAYGYGILAITYFNLGETKAAREYSARAFELRERGSEREKLWIMAQYYNNVSGELENAIEAAEQLRQSYPRDAPAHNVLAIVYGKVGQNEKAVEELQATIVLDPNWIAPYFSLALYLTRLGRLAEAREVVQQAVSRKLDNPNLHYNLFMIAFILGDETGMKEQMDWESARPIGSLGFTLQNSVAAFSGQVRRVQEFSRSEIERAQSGNSGAASDTAAQDATMNAFLGNCRQAREIVAQALTSDRGNGAKTNEAITLAMCGDLGQAQLICDELARQNPKDTKLNIIWLPTIRAAIEIRKDNAAAAIQLLQAAGPYEAAGSFWPTYVRAQAYLRQKSGAKASAEFQKILDHRGWDPTSYLYPLAHLGLARAAWLTGDVAGSRKSYQDFLALWKDADADLPILIEAKKEYAALNR